MGSTKCYEIYYGTVVISWDVVRFSVRFRNDLNKATINDNVENLQKKCAWRSETW